MNTLRFVNIKTATVKKTRASKMRKVTSQVCKCPRASLCFLVFKKTFMPLGRSWWTHRQTPQNVCAAKTSKDQQAGLEQGANPEFPHSDFWFMQTEGDRNELQQQCSGHWVNTDFGNPKGIWHHPHPISFLSGLWGQLTLWFLLALSWTGWY